MHGPIYVQILLHRAQQRIAISPDPFQHCWAVGGGQHLAERLNQDLQRRCSGAASQAHCMQLWYPDVCQVVVEPNCLLPAAPQQDLLQQELGVLLAESRVPARQQRRRPKQKRTAQLRQRQAQKSTACEACWF